MTKKLMMITFALALLAVGCFEIVNGNFIVVIPLKDRDLTTDNSFDRWWVSKDDPDNEDWRDHQDDINHVVDIGFSVTLINNEPSTDATGEFYISKDSLLTAADLTESSTAAFRVISGLVVPAGTTKHITWQESYRYMSNMDVLKKYVMSGEFWLYVKGVETPLNLSLRKTAVIATLNAKPS
jgi:hypothetical protein